MKSPCLRFGACACLRSQSPLSFILLSILVGLILFGLRAGLPAPASAAAVLPAGFVETQVATGLASPTAMAIAPDGRIFVCLQGGAMR
ncbi:MAG: hypothetical protein SF339_07220, partial [Blastocatellia bacterium]|nr:hypothetical protein [Blastocatellia bacterium]